MARPGMLGCGSVGSGKVRSGFVCRGALGRCFGAACNGRVRYAEAWIFKSEEIA